MADWIIKPGNAIDIDINTSWSNLAGNSVDLSFEPDGICSGHWVTRPPLDIAFTFTKDWVAQPALSIPFVFECGGGGETTYTIFSGFIEGHTGDWSDLTDLAATYSLYARALSGETAAASLHPTLLFTARTGEQITGGTCEIIQESNPALYFWDTFYNDSTISTSPHSVTLKISALAPTDGRTGTNVVTDPVSFVDAGQNIRTQFRITRTGDFYDNDNTDAALEFGYFWADEFADIVSPTTTWSYHNPYFLGTNPTSVSVWIPWGGTGGRVFVRRSGVADGTTNWTNPGGFTWDNGSRLISTRLYEVSGTFYFEVYADDTLLVQVNLGATTRPTHVVPLWHYRNYNNAATTVAITDIISTGCIGDPVTFFPGPGLHEPTAPSGESVSAALAPTYALYPLANSGEVGTVALSVTRSLYANGYAGEYSVAVLDSRPAWLPTFRAYSGETGATAGLSTSGAFATAVAYVGELTSVVLQDHAADIFSPTVYVGEVGTVSLKTDITFTFRAYDGDTNSLTLNTYPAPEMELNGYDGQSSTFTFQIGRNLGTITGRSGETTTAGISNQDNWVVKTSEVLEFNLATDPIFPMSYFGGENSSVVLKTGPSEPLGLFRAYGGQSVAGTLETQPSAILQPNPILQWHDAVVGFETSTSFDLLNKSCCPVLDSYERIELNEMEPPDIQYSGTKVIFTADLSTRPRFYLNAYQGSSFEIVDPNWFDVFNAYSGQVSRTIALEFEEYNFNLCYGNLIPDSQFADVELVDLTNWNCEAHAAYSGETMSVSTLQNNVQFEPVSPSGSRLDLVLTVDPAWLLLAYSGERMYWLNTEVNPRVRAGEQVTLQFYEPPLNAYAGQSAALTALTTEYAVEFMELGCLDNEFIPADEDGDPDPDNANPVPVELDFFVHSIKARCF